jgi:hypothetical protein
MDPAQWERCITDTIAETVFTLDLELDVAQDPLRVTTRTLWSPLKKLGNPGIGPDMQCQIRVEQSTQIDHIDQPIMDGLIDQRLMVSRSIPQIVQSGHSLIDRFRRCAVWEGQMKMRNPQNVHVRP